MNEYKVFFFNRPLEPGDVAAAVRQFGSPALVCLSPSNEKYKSEVDKGIEVNIRTGILRSEVWLADQQVVSPVNRWASLEIVKEAERQLSHNIDVFETPEENINVFQEPVRSRGRPRVSGPYMSRTTRWRRQKEAFASNKLLI